MYTLLLLVTLVVLLTGSISLIVFLDDWYRWHDVGVISTVIISAILGLFLIVWPINYYSDESSVVQYNAAKRTIQIARHNGTDSVETAALTSKIISINNDLANAKYWNKTVFDWFIPDNYANLPYLK